MSECRDDFVSDIMILTAESTDFGELRVYCTQLHSVVTYFSDDGDGCVTLHAERGEFACPWSTTHEKLQAVRAAVLDEVSRRLGCYPDQVELHGMEEILRIADPLLKMRPTWTGRAKSLRRGVR